MSPTRSRSRINGIRTRSVLAVLACILAVSGAAARAETWTEFGPVADEAPAVGDSIGEPFFAFMLARVEEDSLGVWTGEDIRRFAAQRGARSRFPLELVKQLSRLRPPPGDGGRFAGDPVRARWVLELTEDLDRPMPYDILGYHPGSLLVSRRLELRELALGNQTVPGRNDAGDGPARFQDVHLFALVAGHLVLDADGLIDALLGSALDDAWTVGLVTARQDGRRIGLGVSLGRKDRRIYGEFDFVRDKVLPHGRPSTSALSSWSRRWLNPDRGFVPRPWTGLGGS